MIQLKKHIFRKDSDLYGTILENDRYDRKGFWLFTF